LKTSTAEILVHPVNPVIPSQKISRKAVVDRTNIPTFQRHAAGYGPRVQIRHLVLITVTLALGACATRDTAHTVKVSIADEKMVVYRHGVPIATYAVSTSKFGLGDRPGSRATPLGKLEIAKKIGDGEPAGMKFKSRRPTGEIVAANAPGRDPIVSRILWLRGLEPQNRNAFNRAIYIHGTAEEWKVGTPASYGCIRMTSNDVISLFNTVGIGAQVEITRDHLPITNLVGNSTPAVATN
jgi:lipoprotein-anchoring transpeptidase ErfK/SrfK